MFGTIRFFIEMMLLYGSEFFNNPRYQWVARNLQTREIKCQGYTAELLYAATLDHLRDSGRIVDGGVSTALEQLVHGSRLVEHACTAKQTTVHDDQVLRILQSPVYSYSESEHAAARKAVTETREEIGRLDGDWSARGFVALALCKWVLGPHFLRDPFQVWLTRPSMTAFGLDPDRLYRTLRSRT
jgi:hypothetical protein